MAALGASQAPGLIPVAHASTQDHDRQVQDAPPAGTPIDGDSPYVTELPPLNTPTGPVATAPPAGTTTVTVPGTGASLPTTVLAAYQRAEAAIAQSDPGCHLPWELLAAIGQVESGQARGGAVDANGTTYQPILGPVLNGNGFADITDTDGGKYDGDPVHDRAVGPMQFIPSTWERWGADGNGDGVADPNNVYDAALAAGHYLCADGRDLAVPAEMDRAILGYNHSQAYLNLVRAWYDHFRKGGAVSVPDQGGSHAPGVTIPLPPAVPTGKGGSGGSGTASPKPTKTSSGSVTTPTPTTSPTGSPTTSPTDGGSPTGEPPTSGDPTTTPPTDDPTSGDPTTPPTDDPTSPGCPTDTPTDTPTDAGSASPSATDPTDPADPDPCATDTPTPTDTPTAAGATGSAL